MVHKGVMLCRYLCYGDVSSVLFLLDFERFVMPTMIVPTHAKFYRPETGSVRTVPMKGELQKAQLFVTVAIQLEDKSVEAENPEDKEFFDKLAQTIGKKATNLVQEHWLDFHIQQMGELTPEVASWIFNGYVFKTIETKD